MVIFGHLLIICVWLFWSFLAFTGIGQKGGYSKFLEYSAFFIPFYSLSFGVAGFQLSIYKILPLFLLLMNARLIVQPRKAPSLISGYFLIISIASYIFAYAQGKFEYIIDLGRSADSIYLQPLVHGIFFIMAIIQIWLINRRFNIDYSKVLAAYFYGCLALVLIGYIQIFIYTAGLPWFDFWFLGDALGRDTESGMADHALDRGFFRMSSLGGEPRHFASLLALGCFVGIYLRGLNSKIYLVSGHLGVYAMSFIMSGILLSLSASGFAALLLGGTVYLLHSRIRMIALYALALCILYFVFGDNDLFHALTWKLENMQMMLYAAPKDAFIFNAIADNYLSFIFGYGVNLAELYIYDYYLFQETPFGVVDRLAGDSPMESSVVPTSPILQIISNGGFVGIFLVGWLIKREIVAGRKQARGVIIAIIAMMFFSSGLILSVGMFAIGLILAHEKSNICMTGA